MAVLTLEALAAGSGSPNFDLSRRFVTARTFVHPLILFHTLSFSHFLTPHVLRHTFSYNYLEKMGNDLVGLANILGHNNVTTTQIYTQKPLGALQDEIEKMQFF